MRLLVAEDDPALLAVLARGLRQHGYVVDTAARGDDALDLLDTGEYAAAILDWRMPGLDGVQVIVSVRRKNRTIPVLLLTARDTPADRITGLDSGADDYIVKPFDFGELLARLRAMLRRTGGDGAPLMRVAGLELDPATHEVRSAGELVQVTPREYAILEVLMRRAGKVITRHNLAEQVWPD